MHHDARFPHFRLAASLLTVAALTFTLATPDTAQADAVRCKREIAKASLRFADTKVRALQKCEDGVLTGKITGPCPDAKATTAITKATTKLRAAIDKKCGGADRDCGTPSDNDALASIGWGSQCPNFEAGTCTNAITNCDGIGNCLLCIDEKAVDQGIDLYYDALANTTDNAVKRCQREIGKNAVKYLRLKAKILQKCKDKVLSGAAPGPCPDAKATALIANAAAKKNAKICSACGGGDRVCGGGDDIPPATIGFAANCPDVTVPGGAACGGPVGTLQQLVNCVSCVTDFKSECVDRLATPSLGAYPDECKGEVVSEDCGNDVVDIGEQCDGTSDLACPGQCSPTCFCPAGDCSLPSPLPSKVSFEGRPGSDLDTGWTGIGHDTQTINDAALMAGSLSNCDTDLGSPSCGQCDMTGPIAFPGPAKNCVCFNVGNADSSSLAVCDPQAPSCAGAETCECLLGPPLPISAGAVPVCVINRLVGGVTGTANISETGPNAGTGAVRLNLIASVHNGVAVEQPCPLCLGDPTPRDGIKGGTCKDGVRHGLPCDVGGVSEFFGSHSQDCLPPAAAGIGNLKVGFNPATTGTTQMNTNRPCTDMTGPCFCSTCATAAAEPCNSNADCPVGVVCGARRCVGGSNEGFQCTDNSQCPGGGFCNRPGQPTKRNACVDQICSPNLADGPNEGLCESGPTDRACSLEPFRGCNNNGDCNPPPAGTCPTCLSGQSCDTFLRQCFLDPIVRQGTPDTETPTVAATFCIPPTTSQSVNQVAGLPGPGALELPTRVFKIGAECGDGNIDAGEDCDGAADGACPGACQVDCQCPGCGNGTIDVGEDCDGTDDDNCPGQCTGLCQCPSTCPNGIREFGEDCDGTDDEQCPGACQGDCTCGAVCGDNVVEGTEQCDGAGSTACPAEACQNDCTCGPFCGDGTIDPGETCDGTGVGVCPGTCQIDCTCSPVCGDDVRQTGELCDGSDDSLCPGDCTDVCTCPGSGSLRFTVIPGSDLDTGWTGTAHDLEVQTGSTILGDLSSCDGSTDFTCDFFGNVGSFCSADPSRSCTADNQCTDAGTCQINTFGPPLPLSAGGVPACIINRFATDVVGTYNLQTGSSTLKVTLNSLVHLGSQVSAPCPICDCGHANCAIGEAGTCTGILGSPPCTVEGTGPLGATSNDCPPSSSLNVSGGGLNILFDPLTTGTVTTPSSQLCDGPGYTDRNCWCDGQPQPNQCAFACDGGSNDGNTCSNDGECPGAPAGACKPLCRQIPSEVTGEGECVAGPIAQTCAGAPEVGCQTNGDCPAGKGPCNARNQRCFLDPMVRIGTPGTSTSIGASNFCIPATSGQAINQTAGLPGPGAILLNTETDVALCGDNVINQAREECDGTSDANCPGTCQPNCTCARECGNGETEFGEQCDPGPPADDSACPGACVAEGQPGECTCPPVCGDGFVGPGEQCDPPSDSACPGTCLPASCQCPLPTPSQCLNNQLDPGEACDLPAIGCGPLQACIACTQCFPPPDIIPPELGFICGNQNVEPTEVCEIPAIGCDDGELCNPETCDECIDTGLGPLCGNLNIEGTEACELPSIGCGPGETCLLCNQCIPTLPICGNLNIEPGEACELPARGCSPLQVCLLCTQCVP